MNERERGGARDKGRREGGTQKGTECVCVCEREREREMERVGACERRKSALACVRESDIGGGKEKKRKGATKLGVHIFSL